MGLRNEAGKYAHLLLKLLFFPRVHNIVIVKYLKNTEKYIEGKLPLIPEVINVKI